MLSEKERQAAKRKQFAEMYGYKSGLSRFIFPVTGRRCGKTIFANYWLQAQKSRVITTTMANYLKQDVQATNMMIQMNYADTERRVLAHFIKCGNDCPFIEMLFPEVKNEKTKNESG